MTGGQSFVETRVFERRTETESKHFAFQNSGLSQVFKLIVSTSEKILNNINGVKTSSVGERFIPFLIIKSAYFGDAYYASWLTSTISRHIL